MNASSLLITLSAGLLLAAAVPLAATEAPSLTVDCATRALPRQHQVGELLDLHNFSQTYAARARLMTQAGRACKQTGARQVRLVLEATPDRSAAVARRLARQPQPAR